MSPRGQAQATPEPVTGDQTSGPNDPVRLIAMPAVPYRRTPWWRRILSFGGLGVLALVLGALLAVVVGLAIVVAFLALNGTAR